MNARGEYFFTLSQTDGLGLPAISLYLRGCDIEVPCIQCNNPELFLETENEIYIDGLLESFKLYLDKFISVYGNQNIRVVITGGDPLSRKNRAITHTVSRYVKDIYNTSIVIIYSWRNTMQIEEENLSRFLRYVDYGVLGPFDINSYVPNTIPSSTNQGIYNLKTGFRQREIIL